MLITAVAAEAVLVGGHRDSRWAGGIVVPAAAAVPTARRAREQYRGNRRTRQASATSRSASSMHTDT